MLADKMAAAVENFIHVSGFVAMPVFQPVEVDEIDIGRKLFQRGVDVARHAEIDQTDFFLLIKKRHMAAMQNMTGRFGGADDDIRFTQAVLDAVKGAEFYILPDIGNVGRLTW